MDDGRRERIMIACVTFETVKITEPIRFYESTKVHLIHYTSTISDSKDIYQAFYDTVYGMIKERSTEIEIVEHIANVTDFSMMMKTVHSIIDEELKKSPNNDIFVNISAGSSEYVAAAVITSMMFPETIPFSVPSNEYTINAKYYFDTETNKPVGLTKSVRSPRPIPQFSIDAPDRHLVLGLRILEKLNNRSRPPKNTEVIECLKENRLWFRGEFPEESGKRSEAVYYLRDFVNIWTSKNWVCKDRLTKRYLLTEKGRSIINTFYCDEMLNLN